MVKAIQMAQNHPYIFAEFQEYFHFGNVTMCTERTL